MEMSTRFNCFLSRLKTLDHSQRFHTTLSKAQIQPQMSPNTIGQIDTSRWRKVDSRMLGIKRSIIPIPSMTVLNTLHRKGFEAYLVGGCVRDLLLKKTPKDFDVITTANLKQVKKQFHRSHIVGKFPICMVHIKGSIIEVSSFDPLSNHAKESVIDFSNSKISGSDNRDFIRWRDSMNRDFTINSLFYDPFMNRIYDYTGGMKDLKSFKLKTLVPAHVSFKEDCARILRGIRIAARLGLSFSKDIETAIQKLSPSIMTLSKSRILMEMNYMLSYGAAAPSISLLQRFNLLERLLPFHAAYLAEQSCKETAESSMMLMKLFCNLDKLITCDRPSPCTLWVGLLAFHHALVNNSQDALVVWTFSSILYHGQWNKGLMLARQHAKAHVSFVPEILKPCHSKSAGTLAKEVKKLALLVKDSIEYFTQKDSLFDSKSRFSFPTSADLCMEVFIPKKTGKHVAEIFSVLLNYVEYYEEERENIDINYGLLVNGDSGELRYVLGKVIFDTMIDGIVQEKTNIVNEQKNERAVVADILQNNEKQRSDFPKQKRHKDEKLSQNKKPKVDVCDLIQENEIISREVVGSPKLNRR